MATPLVKGYNIVIQQNVGGVNTPIYPITKLANVQNAQGESIIDVLKAYATTEYVDGKNYVPELQEASDSLTFLRNDGTWQKIQSAGIGQAGVVQLSSEIDSDSEETAATSKVVKTLKAAIDAVSKDSGDSYVKKTQLGAAHPKLQHQLHLLL